MTFLDRLNSPKCDFTQNRSCGKIIKCQQIQALTSHFESFCGIVDLALFWVLYNYTEPCRNLKSLSIVDITDDAQATCARLMEENCNFIKTIFKYQLHFLFLLFFLLMCNTVTTSVRKINFIFCTKEIIMVRRLYQEMIQ